LVINYEVCSIPLLVNMVEGRETPILPFEELQDMGFKIVLYPTSSIRAVAKTIQDLAAHLYRHKDTIEIQEKLITFEGRNHITGLAMIRARPKISSHFRISSSYHLRPILIRKILEIVLLFLWFCAIGSSKSNTNLSANSVKLFLGEP